MPCTCLADVFCYSVLIDPNASQELQKSEVPEVEDELDSDSDSESTGNFASRAVEKVLNLPGISFLKPSLSGLLKTLAANTVIALAAVAIPAVLFLVLLSSLFGGKKASSVVRPAMTQLADMVERHAGHTCVFS